MRRLSISAVEPRENYPAPAAAVEDPVLAVNAGWRGLRASLRPLLLASRVWGLAPVTVAQSERAKSSYVLYSIFVGLVVLTSTHIGAIVLTMTSETSTRHVRYVAGTGQIIFNRLCGILNHGFLILYRNTFASAVASIVALDDEWKPKSSDKSAVYIYVELLTMWCVIVADTYPILVHNYTWPVYIFEIWQNIAIIHSLSVLILQWTNLVLSLAHHMETLTVELAKLNPEPDDDFPVIPPSTKHQWMFLLIENEVGQGQKKMNIEVRPKSKERSITIPSLRKLHRDIHSALQKLQTAYGGPLTIGFSIVIVNTVIAVFELKHSYSITNTGTFEVFWALWCILLTYLMVMPCQKLLDKTQECADILHGAMQNEIQAEERKQLLDFSVQLLDLPLTCSSCNFFLLDNRKLISVLGTIVTYVIILSQFDTTGQRVDGFSNLTNSTNCSVPDS